MAEAVSNIRVFELAEALRSSIEREMATQFTVYLPVSYETKADSHFEIKIRTQTGHIFLTVQQRAPGDLVKYVSHRFASLTEE